jgi:hypothetical protein
MITCYLQGGLGNQLFQIFTTISYALQLQTSFFFFTQDKLTNRNTYWNNFLQKMKPFLRTEKNIPLLAFVNEESFTYHNFTPKLQENKNITSTMLVGYFQSYKYFEKYNNQLFRIIDLRRQQEIIYTKYNKYYNFETTISLHFRFGDYMKLTNIYIILDTHYYTNAIYHILQNNNHITKIIYFYELQDKSHIQSIITQLESLFPQLVFEECSQELVDYEQLLLMSICKYNIIANSTFSWWGAYFNTNSQKIVCYPSKWFVNSTNTCDLFPSQWTSIEI